jgi:protein transport protein SEC24
MDAGYGAQPAQLFTPGLAADNQFAAQQQQPQPQPGGQFFSPGTPAGYGQPQPPAYSAQPNVDQLAGQFGSMGFGGGGGQKPFQLYTANLLASPPEPLELHRPPPEIRLPPGAALVANPNINPDPSYQRTTLNAIPTTSSLLAKSKLPLALVVTPYRTTKEGEPEVPLVTDTVIARCRRCRTYINPFVQFIDGGNRCVNPLKPPFCPTKSKMRSCPVS